MVVTVNVFVFFSSCSSTVCEELRGWIKEGTARTGWTTVAYRELMSGRQDQIRTPCPSNDGRLLPLVYIDGANSVDSVYTLKQLPTTESEVNTVVCLSCWLLLVENSNLRTISVKIYRVKEINRNRTNS